MGEINYRPAIEGMTWSYSRIGCFQACRYRWYLKYLRSLRGDDRFFSSYGRFLHQILERHLSGQLPESELATYYLANFSREVIPPAPSHAVFRSYFEQGLQYLRSGRMLPYRELLAVEDRAQFNVDGFPFVGVIDCIARDGGDLVVIDHKSRALKPRSGKRKPTRADEELDAYLRQLYLYCVPIKDRFGAYPARLEFNCFRTGMLISEPFDPVRYQEAQDWAAHMVSEILDCDDWSPDMDYFKCRYLCEVSDECEYFQLNYGR